VIKAAVVALAVVAALVAGVLGFRGGGSDGKSITSAPADPDHFRVDGTEIHAPGSHAPFVPVGMNLLGPDAFFNAEGHTAGLASVLADDWKVNTVRLNTCLPEGCGYTDVTNRNNDDLDGIVKELTAKKIVVILALHQVQPGSLPSGSVLDEIEQWWRDQASRYADNPYVWFNVLNEPGHGKPAPKAWLQVHERLVGAIRDEAPDSLVVVDGTQWGQEVGGVDTGKVVKANSAVLDFGRALEAQFGNIVFSFHVYDQWGVPRSDEDRDARMADYIDRVHRAGLALVIGEVGGAWKECCEKEALAAQTAYRVAPPRGVGILAWHGQAVDQHKLIDREPPTSPDQIDSPTDPTNLTWMGQLLWDLAHKEAA
jgi:mannan endo-1,4-beta-mannosidase